VPVVIESPDTPLAGNLAASIVPLVIALAAWLWLAAAKSPVFAVAAVPSPKFVRAVAVLPRFARLSALLSSIRSVFAESR
jgi:hypothetical protein